MTPEEQNAVNTQQKTDSLLQRKLWAYKQWRQNVDAEYANQQEASMEQDTMNLYQNSLQATDKDVKAQYNVASRWNLLAEMISNVGREKGYEITGNASDIIWTYLQWFPNDSQAFYEFTHWDQDPEDFAVQMGWMEKPENDAGFITNVVWWAYDSATWLPRMIGKWAADAIGWVAKQFWADDAKVDELVSGYKNYLDSDWSSEAIGSDKDSWTYKWSKLVWDLAQVATAEWLAKNAIKSTPLWKVAMDAIKQAPLGYRAAAWAIKWAADMWLYDMVSESELPSGQDLAMWAAFWVASPILWAGYKAVKWAVKKWAVNAAEDIIQNANRMTKWQQQEFFKMTWQSQGKFMNDRWLKTYDDVAKHFTESKDKVDNAMWTIQWRFTSDELTKIIEWVDWMEWVVDFAVETQNPLANRMIELAEKNRNWWLTMSEINEVKRFFEKHNKFNYWHPERWNSKKFETATNMDNALREWQISTAEKNWFDTLRELNKETQGAAYILNKSKDRAEWVKGNNLLELTDWITAMWWWVSVEWIAALLGKKAFQTPRVKGMIVDMLNRVGWHENLAEKQANLKKIMELNSVKEVEKQFKEWWVWDTTPKLEYKGMEQATDNSAFTKLRDADRPKPVKEVDMSKNNPRLVDKEVVENIPVNAKKSDKRLDLANSWEWLSKLRSKKADYMIVSAENFNWQPQSAGVNSKSTAAFRKFLDDNWIAWKHQIGMYDNLERSQIIAIDNPKQRAIIDTWIKENAPQAENIIVKNWKAYRYDPVTNEAYYVDLKKADLDLPADATNYYSEIDGRKYQLPLYSEAEKPISAEEFLSIYNS